MSFINYKTPINISFILIIGFILSCKTNYYNVKRISITKYAMDTSNRVADPELLNLIMPYHDELDAEMGKILSYNDTLMEKSFPEGSLGNFYCDVMIEKAAQYCNTTADLAIVNGGGLRVPYINRGPVTKGKVFELAPFENELVVLDIKGKLLQQLIEQGVAKGGWPVSHGTLIHIDTIQHITKSWINGLPLDSSKQYKVVTNDYLANGGDLCDFLREEKRINSGKIIRDLFIEYLMEHDTIHFIKEGRTQYVH